MKLAAGGWPAISPETYFVVGGGESCRRDVLLIVSGSQSIISY